VSGNSSGRIRTLVPSGTIGAGGATPRGVDDSRHRPARLKTCIAAAAVQAAVIAGAVAVPAGPAPAGPAPDTPHPFTCLQTGEETAPLESRVGAPDPEIRDIFAGSGASDISVHELTQAERTLLKRALARLPALHRDVLQRHLRRLSFLDLQSGAGSALTSRVGLDETSTRFDITLRAGLLTESLSTFLTTKEARLFRGDGSGVGIAFDAGATDALTYVLLHEATHVVDLVLGLTADADSPFRAGIWTDARTLAPPHAGSLAAKTPFRREAPVPLQQAPAFYEALRQSPFVSAYATAAASEDLAELFAWHHLASRLDQPLALTVRSGDGTTLYRYHPLETPAVQARFALVEDVLERHQSCAAP